jgi:WD40 repeat protein
MFFRKTSNQRLLLIALSVLLAGCGELPFGLGSSPAQPEIPPAAATPRPVYTITPAASLVPTITPSITPTITPLPTLRSPYPVGPGTPMPDAGFPRISTNNTNWLTRVFNYSTNSRRAILVTPDEQKILLASAESLSLYAVSGELIANWPEIKMADVKCDSCLAVNHDASRFAVALREKGQWFIKVYAIDLNQLTLLSTIPAPETIDLDANPVQVALAPFDELLAYRFGKQPLTLINFASEEVILEYSGPSQSISISVGGQYLIARRERDLVYWDVYNLAAAPRTISLGSPDAAFLFSRGGEYAVVFAGSKIRFYYVFPLRLAGEVDIPQARGQQVTWQIATESDESFIRATGLYWDAAAETYQAIQGRWEFWSRDTLSVTVSPTNQTDAFDAFWGLNFPSETSSLAVLNLEDLRAMRFFSPDSLFVSAQETICFIRLNSAEIDCKTYEAERIHTSEGPVFREIQEDGKISLLNPVGETLFETGSLPIYWVNRNGEFILLDNRGSTTDLYRKGQRLPVESAPGILQSVSENLTHIAFLTRQANGVSYITLVEKGTGRTIFQKRDTLLANVLEMTVDGRIYYLRETYSGETVNLWTIDPQSGEAQPLFEVEIAAPITAFTLAPNSLAAFGMQDGSILLLALDSLIYETYQALQTPVTALAFSSDGRYLAVTGRELLSVFAVLPR